MTTALQLRRGTTTQHATFAGAQGEVTVDTDKKTVVVHDGTTKGGSPLARASDIQAFVRHDTASQGLNTTQQGNVRTAIGLGNVNNTADVNKPVSTAQQNALNLKLDKAGGSLSGPLVLAGDATEPLQAVPKQQLDALAGEALTAATSNGVPPGSVIYVASNTAPTGYLRANGATVSRTTYAALFAVIGTTFGVGDGSTTFNIPDLRGEFIRSLDDGRGVDVSRDLGSAQEHQMQRHTHTAAVRSIIRVNPGTSTGSYYYANSETSSGAAGGTSNSSENRPRNVALLACIRF